MLADRVTPFAFESMAVRGALIHLSRTWRRMQRDRGYDSLVAETLGQSAAATGLIAQSLKFDGAITLQLQGSDVLQMLVMQCTDDLDLRGMAVVAEGHSANNFLELVGDALLLWMPGSVRTRVLLQLMAIPCRRAWSIISNVRCSCLAMLRWSQTSR